MKTTFSIAAALVAALLAAGCGSSKYGRELTLREATPIAAILADPAAYKGRRVLVEGTVTEVCAMMGCWIVIQGSGEGEMLRFKVEDGVIEFPMGVKGKVVRAEGTVSVKQMSVDEQIAEGRHHADEAGTTFDPSTITGPKTKVQLEGEGAVIR